MLHGAHPRCCPPCKLHSRFPDQNLFQTSFRFYTHIECVGQIQLSEHELTYYETWVPRIDSLEVSLGKDIQYLKGNKEIDNFWKFCVS